MLNIRGKTMLASGRYLSLQLKLHFITAGLIFCRFGHQIKPDCWVRLIKPLYLYLNWKWLPIKCYKKQTNKQKHLNTFTFFSMPLFSLLHVLKPGWFYDSLGFYPIRLIVTKLPRGVQRTRLLPIESMAKTVKRPKLYVDVKSILETQAAVFSRKVMDFEWRFLALLILQDTFKKRNILFINKSSTCATFFCNSIHLMTRFHSCLQPFCSCCCLNGQISPRCHRCAFVLIALITVCNTHTHTY